MTANEATSLTYAILVIPSLTWLIYSAFKGRKWPIIAVSIWLAINVGDINYKKDTVIRGFFQEILRQDKQGTSSANTPSTPC